MRLWISNAGHSLNKSAVRLHLYFLNQLYQLNMLKKRTDQARNILNKFCR